jgi:hypothetical protein
VLRRMCQGEALSEDKSEREQQAEIDQADHPWLLARSATTDNVQYVGVHRQRTTCGTSETPGCAGVQAIPGVRFISAICTCSSNDGNRAGSSPVTCVHTLCLSSRT